MYLYVHVGLEDTFENPVFLLAELGEEEVKLLAEYRNSLLANKVKFPELMQMDFTNSKIKCHFYALTDQVLEIQVNKEWGTADALAEIIKASDKLKDPDQCEIHITEDEFWFYLEVHDNAVHSSSVPWSVLSKII